MSNETQEIGIETLPPDEFLKALAHPDVQNNLRTAKEMLFLVEHATSYAEAVQVQADIMDRLVKSRRNVQSDLIKIVDAKDKAIKKRDQKIEELHAKIDSLTDALTSADKLVISAGERLTGLIESGYNQDALLVRTITEALELFSKLDGEQNEGQLGQDNR